MQTGSRKYFGTKVVGAIDLEIQLPSSVLGHAAAYCGGRSFELSISRYSYPVQYWDLRQPTVGAYRLLTNYW